MTPIPITRKEAEVLIKGHQGESDSCRNFANTLRHSPCGTGSDQQSKEESLRHAELLAEKHTARAEELAKLAEGMPNE